MVTVNLSESPLADLQTLEEYQRERPHVFPSIESGRWFIRNHRTALAVGGALLVIAGRQKIRPKQMDEYVVIAGRDAAVRGKVAA